MSGRPRLTAYTLALCTTLTGHVNSVHGAEPAPTTAAPSRHLIGEPIELDADGAKFSALYTADTTGKPKGASLILHDRGLNPDEPQVSAPLRKTLPESGWATLAIQLPTLDRKSPHSAYGGTLEEALKRAQAGLADLKSKGLMNVVVVGHGLGAVTGIALVAAAPDPSLRALALIGMTATDDLTPAPVLAPMLDKLNVPILDIVGTRDHAHVLNAAAKRAVAKAKDDRYALIKLDGADHGFTGMQAVLVKRVRGWMEKHAPSMETPKSSSSSSLPK